MKYLQLVGMAALIALPVVAGVTGKVNANRLNLRVRPATAAPVAAQVNSGSELEVLAVKDNWVEVAAPAETKIYVSEALIDHDKTIREINMRLGMGGNAPILGTLPAGTQVKLIDERAYGWVRIAPPENLRLYAVKFYVDFDAEKLAKETEKTASEAPKTEVKAEAEVASAPAPEVPKSETPKVETPEPAPAEATNGKAVIIPPAADAPAVAK